MTPVIVPLTRAHIDAFWPYEHLLFGNDAWTKAMYRDEIADHRYRHYVVAEDDDGRLLGWAGVLVLPDHAQVMTIGVVPEAQRQGIGQQLLDALLDEARRRGASTVFLEVRTSNDAAQRLYRRNGFTDLRVRRGYYDAGRADALEMQRVL